MHPPNYPPIVVVGPQRSGTTITSKILAYDLERTPIDEGEFVLGKDYTNCVLQLPHAIDSYIYLQHYYPGIHFVWVNRSTDDIITSMKRIQWCKEDVVDWEVFLERYVISRIKLWQHVKSQIPDSCSEITYEALEDHPLFVAKDKRVEFTSKQWQVNQPLGPRYWSNNQECIREYYGSRHTSSTQE